MKWIGCLWGCAFECRLSTLLPVLRVGEGEGALAGVEEGEGHASCQTNLRSRRTTECDYFVKVK